CLDPEVHGSPDRLAPASQVSRSRAVRKLATEEGKGLRVAAGAAAASTHFDLPTATGSERRARRGTKTRSPGQPRRRPSTNRDRARPTSPLRLARPPPRPGGIRAGAEV